MRARKRERERESRGVEREKVCVCVCRGVRERARARERERQRERSHRRTQDLSVGSLHGLLDGSAPHLGWREGQGAESAKCNVLIAQLAQQVGQLTQQHLCH